MGQTKMKLVFLKDHGSFKKGDKIEPSDHGISVEKAEEMKKAGIVKIQQVHV